MACAFEEDEVALVAEKGDDFQAHALLSIEGDHGRQVTAIKKGTLSGPT
jgi:hypothetical protein